MMDEEYTEDMLNEQSNKDMLNGFNCAIESLIDRKEELEDDDEYDHRYPVISRLMNEMRIKIYDEIIDNLEVDCYEFLIGLVEMEEEEKNKNEERCVGIFIRGPR